jgi:peptide/nickel transport system permease protein
MSRYLLRRVAESLITLALATMVVFAGVRALPGDPARALAGEENDPARVAAVRAKYGLDDSVWVQYWHYLTNSFSGDFGTSVRTNIPVGDMLKSALPVTLELSVLALTVAALIGVLTGVLAAVRRGRPTEWLANGFALLGLSVPNFWLGLMAILYLSVSLDLFPASGHVPFLEDPAANLHHMVLPALVLGTGLAAVIMRQTRSSMLDALGTDYIRTARAKGLREYTVVGVHALRNSLIVVVTIVGLQLGALISGAVVTERIFGLPGFGKLTLDSVFQRDYPVIQGVVLVTASAYILINLLVDLLYSLIDPRIRVAGEVA